MKNLACILLLCFAMTAAAGEKPLGVIVSVAGGDTTNATTATPFKIPLGSKLTINCTNATTVCTDTSSACVLQGGGANFGVSIAASYNFPTSTDQQAKVVDTSGTAANGGSIVRIVAAAASTCYVMARNGNE